MSNGPPAAAKPLAHALAQLLSSDTGVRVAAGIRLAALRGQDLVSSGLKRLRPPGAARLIEPSSIRSVGIWQAQDTADGRAFLRSGPASPLWADVEQIGPKRGRRVVLLGESVARAYLYDPEFTMAMALQRALDALPGLGPIEVVDLASTNQGFAPLRKLVDEVVALEPDVAVIFAGNNWHGTMLDRGDFPRMAHELRTGTHRARGFLEKRVDERVSEFTRHIADLGRTSRMQTLLLVPEFNLLDWHGDRGHEVPWLAGGRIPRWLELRADAEAALAGGDLAKAARLATEMLELDQGASAVSTSLLGRAKVALGEDSEARRFFEAARDADIWTLAPQTPRCYGVTQRALLEHGSRHGLSVLDLRRLFSEHLRGALPDRRIFLDYCHLTAEGIGVVVRSVALKLAELLGVAASPGSLSGVNLLPSARIEAGAQFVAAIHNATWGQPVEIVEYRCKQALEASPEVAESMAHFLDFRVRRQPTVLCGSFAALTKEGSRSASRYLGLHWTARKPFSDELTRAVARSLDPVQPGATERLQRLMAEEHAVEHGPVDLLHVTYSCDSYAEPHINRDTSYYQAHGPRSRFFLVVRDPGHGVKLDLALRVPGLTTATSVAILANGSKVGSVAVSRVWSRVVVEVPATALQTGVNRIELEWPREYDDRNRLDNLTDALQEGSRPMFLPVFGEIDSLKARALPQSP